MSVDRAAPSYWRVLAGMVLTVLVAGFVGALAGFALMQVVPGFHEGHQVATMFPVAGAVMAFSWTRWAEERGWRSAFLMAGLTAAVLIICEWLFLW